MVPSNKSELLRAAADANDLAEMARAAADAANAEALDKGAAALLAERQALGAVHPVPPVVVPTAVLSPGAHTAHSAASSERGRRASDGSSGSNSATVAIWGVVVAILLVGLIAWLVWLTAGKADNSRVDHIYKAGVTAQATAVEAKALATTANTTADQALKQAGSAVAIANTANGKADTAVSTADRALRKAQAALNARAHQPASVPHANAGQQQGQNLPHSGQVAAPSSDGSIWLWYHHLATPQKPAQCVISEGEGRGLPPYCNGFKVEPAKPGETKAQWLVRVGGGGRPADKGLYNKGEQG